MTHSQNLQQRVTLYDPHRFVVGINIGRHFPLPFPFIRKAQELDGKTMKLEEAVSYFSKVAEDEVGYLSQRSSHKITGTIEVDENCLRYHQRIHRGDQVDDNSWRLISYRLVDS